MNNKIKFIVLMVGFIGACRPNTLSIHPTLTISYETNMTQTYSPSPTFAHLPTTWKTYTDTTFLISLEYPANWKIDTTGNAVYSGEDGFFQITAGGLMGPSAKPICEMLIQLSMDRPDKENRFGRKPTMETLQVDGQNACLILPSDDQLDSFRDEALLIVEYPSSVRNGALLQFWADKDHMADFIGTLQFIR